MYYGFYEWMSQAADKSPFPPWLLDVCWYGWWISVAMLAVVLCTEVGFGLYMRWWLNKYWDELTDQQREEYMKDRI
jgi:hypothetical protein